MALVISRASLRNQNTGSASKPRFSLPNTSKVCKSASRKTPQAAKPFVKTRDCAGCNETFFEHLFLALFPKNLHDFTQKCFCCRRFDAVSDFYKTHEKGSTLSLAAQLDHLDSQQEILRKWQRTMRNRGFDVSDQELSEIMKVIKTHPAIQQAVIKLSQAEQHHGIHDEEADTVIEEAKETSASSAHGPFLPYPSDSLHPSEEDLSNTFALQAGPVTYTQHTNHKVLAAATALNRAANALHQAHSLADNQLDWIFNGVFRRPFDVDTVQTWADMVTDSVGSAVNQQEFWAVMDEREREAVEVLAKMSRGL